MYKFIVCQCYLNKAVTRNNKHQIPGLYPLKKGTFRQSAVESENLYFPTCPNDSTAQSGLETNGLGGPKKRGQQPRVTPSTILQTPAFLVTFENGQ